nr:PREDICTED: uncharacterized protein LOC106704565 [Latimeria chalumnae]|eukprot:XP_014347346.1 PREDICTED: uncharacterized protein LOC106704565 [Latimeria chalumnae]
MFDLTVESTETLKQLLRSIVDDFIEEELRDVATEEIRSSIKDLVDDHLNMAAIYNSTSEIVTETVQSMLPSIILEAQEEAELEEIFQEEIIPDVVREEISLLVQSELRDSDAEITHLVQSQVSRQASKQLIDTFFLAHLLEMMRNHGRAISVKDQSSRLLDSWMLDALFQQYFGIQKLQQATLENFPLRSFHRKKYTDVALDVILTEISQAMEEDMEDLSEYEQLMEEGEFLFLSNVPL